jgi:hypothetical protein
MIMMMSMAVVVVAAATPGGQGRAVWLIFATHFSNGYVRVKGKPLSPVLFSSINQHKAR